MKPFEIAVLGAVDRFDRSFSDWAIDHFKELAHNGTFIPDNIFHMTCAYDLDLLNLIKSNKSKLRRVK